MKNLTVKPFKTIEEAVAFVNSKGYYSDKQVIDAFFENGYFQFRRWHIVLDPFGRIQEQVSDEVRETGAMHGSEMIYNILCHISENLTGLFKTWSSKK